MRIENDAYSWLDRAAIPAVTSLPIFVTAGAVAGAIPLSVASTILFGIVVACVLALLEPRRFRGVFLSLFVVSLLSHLSVAAVLGAFASPPGSIYLGPDATSYWRGAVDLANSGLLLAGNPAAIFGTFDVAHYYVFAAFLRTFGGGLADLQVLNCVVAALVAPAMYAVGRRLLPGYAALVGVAIALHPSLIALSSTSLLKDPLVAAAMALAAWALTGIVTDDSVAGRLKLAVLGVVALVFLRMDRFYVVALLEVAVAVAAAIYARRLWAQHVRAWTVPLLLGTLILAEAAPMAFGWPNSAVMVVDNIQVVLAADQMRAYSPGLLDKTPVPPAGTPTGDGGESAASARPTLETVPEGLPIVSWLANVGRRILGPFVWVPPKDLHVETLEAGDFLLYPGTLIWYAVFPLVLVGLGSVLLRAVRTAEVSFAATTFAVFVVLYGAMYLAINLSFRQREIITPMLLLFAVCGLLASGRVRAMPKLYATYWIVLLVVAVVDVVAQRITQG